MSNNKMSYSTSPDQLAVSQETGEQKPTASNVPDLVKIGQIPTNSAIDIETDILDPVISNDGSANTTGFIRFQFQNKGILHSHSKIIFRYNANTNSAFCPITTGVHSLIQRARLSVGTKTLCEIDDFQHYIAYKSSFLSNEHQKWREQYVNGRCVCFKPYYDDGSAPSNASGNYYARSDTSASAVGIDTGQELQVSDEFPADPTNKSMAETGSAYLKSHAVMNASFGQEYAISIQDLFPFLYQNQLPLYMMTEPVNIELTLAPQANDRMCLNGSATMAPGGNAVPYDLDLGATQLVADYQYFPQEMMEEYARQNSDMTFTYMDYRLAKRTIAVNASGSEESTGQQILNVGGAGRICTKGIQMCNDDYLTAVKQEETLTNKYHARALKRTYTGTPATDSNGSLTSNLKYNDNFLYPVDVVNPAYHFHNVVTAEGMVPFVTRDCYSNEGGQTTTTSLENQIQGTGTSAIGTEYANNAGIVSKFFYQAWKLNRNERVNTRGIELYNTWTEFQNEEASGVNYTHRAYVELVRVATLKDGKMEVFYA